MVIVLDGRSCGDSGRRGSHFRCGRSPVGVTRDCERCWASPSGSLRGSQRVAGSGSPSSGQVEQALAPPLADETLGAKEAVLRGNGLPVVLPETEEGNGRTDRVDGTYLVP